jgi:thiamine-monophosphate kinase
MARKTTSERALVARLLRSTGIRSEDAVLVRRNGGLLAATTDISFASSHSPRGLSFYQMGWRSAVSNLSDLAAMGAKPLAFLLAQGLPRAIAERASVGIMKGAKDACKLHGAQYAGGDTKRAKEISLAGFALGKLVGKPLLRTNARPGDVVCVSGAIGDAACGFHAVSKNKKAPARLLNAFLKPRALVREGMLVSRSTKRAACMDVSDGLLFTCAEIARLSGVCIELEPLSIPISPEARIFAAANRIPFTILANFGEDYALVFSMSLRDFGRLCRPAGLVCIGMVSNGSGLFLDGRQIKPHGYDSFVG